MSTPAKKRKSTIQIPFSVKTGNVPHWIEKQAYAEAQLAKFKAIRDGGYQNDWSGGEAQWRSWIDQRVETYDYEWRDPEEFVDTFQIIGYGRGRSAAYFELESLTTKMQAVMMMTDMTHLVLNANIFKGVVAGRWIFGKRGQNYGIQFLGE
jgi:hypothetical protein